MFAEELVKIRESETYADELQKNAKAEAETIIAEAEAKAQQLMSDAKLTAKEKMDNLMAEGKRIAQQQYEEAIGASEAKCAALTEAAEKKQTEMVKLIVERVKSSVN